MEPTDPVIRRRLFDYREQKKHHQLAALAAPPPTHRSSTGCASNTPVTRPASWFIHFFISLTGSILVYRNELLSAAIPVPPISQLSGAQLTNQQIILAAAKVYPNFEVTRLRASPEAGAAIEVWMKSGDSQKFRFFDPFSGEDMGSASHRKMNAIYLLMNIHKDFLSGRRGRLVNGFGAIGLLLLVLTGLIIWWPGLTRWRSRLRVHRNVNRRRQIWEAHQAIGVWTALFTLMFGLSGTYLCFQDFFNSIADHIEPLTASNAKNRLVDQVLYWLAFLHFGRLNGIALPCSSSGLCDQSFKAVWAVFGAAPAIMIITGMTMWWNRALRRHFMRKQK